MKIRNIIIALLSICLFSCQSKNGSNQINYVEAGGEMIPILRLDMVDDSATSIPLSTLFDEVKIIPLETNPECLVASFIYTMTDHSVLIAVMNNMRPVSLFEFDLNGKFIREFGGQGKGPGEHQGYMMDDIRWYPEEELILASFLGVPDEKHLFTEEGEFLRKIHVPWSMGREVYHLSNDLYMTAGRTTGVPHYTRDSFQLVLHKSTGEWVQSFPRKVYPPNNKPGYTPMERHSLWRYDDTWRLLSAGDDTLYQISEDSIQAVAVFNFGSSGKRYNQIVEAESDVGKYSVKIMSETERHLYMKKKHVYKVNVTELSPGNFNYSSRELFSLLLYDKKNNAGYNLRFSDDLLGILPKESKRMNLSWSEFGTVCRIEQAVDVLEWIAEAKENNTLPEKARTSILELENSIDENSNPIMFIYMQRDEKEFKSRIEKFIFHN